MHPTIQAELATIHQEELVQSVQDDLVFINAQRMSSRRVHWLPQRLHRKLALLRLRHRSRRYHLARRHYQTTWQHDLHQILDRE